MTTDTKVLDDLHDRLRAAMYEAAVEEWKRVVGIVGHVELTESQAREEQIEQIYDNMTFEDNDTILQLQREIDAVEFIDD